MRLCACVILTWTAVDLLAPQLCAAEPVTIAGVASHESDGSPVRPDSDCFCCSHLVTPMAFDVVFAVSMATVEPALRQTDLPLGVPRTLYRPPLLA